MPGAAAEPDVEQVVSDGCTAGAVLPGRYPEPVVPVRSAEEAIVSGAALAE